MSERRLAKLAHLLSVHDSQSPHMTTTIITSELEDKIQRGTEDRTVPLHLHQVRRTFPMAGIIVKERCGGCENYRPKNADGTVGQCGGFLWQHAEVKATDLKCDDYVERGEAGNRE